MTPAAPSTSLSNFKIICLLGEGAYSAVYKATRLADGETYALKKVKLPSLSEKEKQNALNEVRLLASVRHENVIAFKEAFFDDRSHCLCIVQEHASAGDMYQQVAKCQKEHSYLREIDGWHYLVDMCRGLEALHALQILHRDLKCANVFLSVGVNRLIAKLGDFNVSKVAKRGLCMTQTGTPYYASPEVWRDMPYDAKSDIWSLGCVLYEMLALRPPFCAEDMEGLYHVVLRGVYPRLPQHYSHDFSEVIRNLLQVNSRNRPTADALLQMPVIKRHTAGSCRTTASDGLMPSGLLKTIKFPKNVINLSVCLPKPQYNLTDEQRFCEIVDAESRQGCGAQRRTFSRVEEKSLLKSRGRFACKDAEEMSSDADGVIPNSVLPDSLDIYLEEWEQPRQRCADQGSSEDSRNCAHQGIGGCFAPSFGSAQIGERISNSPKHSAKLRLPQLCRHQREQRRPMANYARLQYSVGTSLPGQQTAQVVKLPCESGGLPQVFIKAG